jgi:RNA polymerase sigma factor (sigma-70 family)
MSSRGATDQAQAPAAGAGQTGAEQQAAELATLMGRYCDGDGTAFHALYAGLAPRILAYLTGLAGDKATAEDLLQQTFMKLHQGRAAYVKGANPAPWLYTIAHRTFLDETRRRKRAHVRISADGELPHEPSVGLSGTGDPEQGAADDSTIARGLEALATIPEPLRQAVLLTKIHGHSTAEAAAIAGISVGALKVRAHRGYLALRRKLGGAANEAESDPSSDPKLAGAR